jgi:hypothetical protein
VLDRTNGRPVWPIEERPVEKGEVPGEWYSPTQPFVTKPPPFDRQGVSPDDVIDFTPELHAEGLKLLSRYKIGPIFTPPVVSQVAGPLGTLILPSVTGGANWQGGALDPDTNKLYIYSVTAPSALGLVQPDPTKSDFGYVLGVARANAPPVQTQTESAGPARDGAAPTGAPGAAPAGQRGQAPAAGGRGAGGRGAAPGGGGGGALEAVALGGALVPPGVVEVGCLVTEAGADGGGVTADDGADGHLADAEGAGDAG